MAMLLSGMFCGDNHSFDYTPTNVPNINKITIKNGIYDDMYATTNVTKVYSEDIKIWDFETILYPLFKNNLYAGNVSFTADTVTAIRIKRRKKGDYKWDALFEIPIKSNADFQFERFDRFARAKTEYEYTLVPMINNVEGNLNTSEIKSDFDGFYFVEKDVVFHAYLNAKIPETNRNHGTVVVETLGSKYPYSIKNGYKNYERGTLESTFIDMGLDCQFDVENGWKFRQLVDNFLTNGRPKILKNDDGQMWLVSIVDQIPKNYQQHWLMPIHTMSWVEVGNPDNPEDLYNSGIIDVDPRLTRW